MVMFNLLPWRAHQQAYLKRQQKRGIAGALAVMILFILFMHILLQQWMDALQLRLSQLQPQVEQVMLRQTAQSSQHTLRQSDQYEALEQSQASVAQLFSKLFNSQSNSVCLTQVNRYQNRIRFQGVAEAPTAFVSFLMNWPLMSSFRQIQIKKMDHGNQGLLEVSFEGIENESRWPGIKQRKRIYQSG